MPKTSGPLDANEFLALHHLISGLISSLEPARQEEGEDLGWRNQWQTISSYAICFTPDALGVWIISNANGTIRAGFRDAGAISNRFTFGTRSFSTYKLPYRGLPKDTLTCALNRVYHLARFTARSSAGPRLQCDAVLVY